MLRRKIDGVLQEELLRIVEEWEMELYEDNNKLDVMKSNGINDSNMQLLTQGRKFKRSGFRGY